MKTTLALLILMTSIFGFVLIGNALAQPADTKPTATSVEKSATEEATPPKTLDQAKGVYNSVKGGHWMLTLAFVGKLFGSAGRWLAAKRWDFITTKAGGYLIAASTGVGILGAGIVESGSFSVDLLSIAVTTMLGAMGLHGPVKALKEKVKGTEG